jgi:hypothetical protein
MSCSAVLTTTARRVWIVVIAFGSRSQLDRVLPSEPTTAQAE